MNGLELAEKILRRGRDHDVASSDYATSTRIGRIERDMRSASNRLKTLAGGRYRVLITGFVSLRERHDHQYDAPWSTEMSDADCRALGEIEEELRALVEPEKPVSPQPLAVCDS